MKKTTSADIEGSAWKPPSSSAAWDSPQVRLYFGPAAAAFVRRQYPGTEVIEVKPIPKEPA